MLTATQPAVILQLELRPKQLPAITTSMCMVILEPMYITVAQALPTKRTLGTWTEQAAALFPTLKILIVHAMLAAKLLEMLLMKVTGALMIMSAILVVK
jgi:hypothetical protein